MIKDMEHHQDDKTVLLDRQGHGPAQSPLTDFAAPPRFEQLEERMIYAARLRPPVPTCCRKWCDSNTATPAKTCTRSTSA